MIFYGEQGNVDENKSSIKPYTTIIFHTINSATNAMFENSFKSHNK